MYIQYLHIMWVCMEGACKCNGSLFSPLLLQSLTDGDNTREHTYSRNERKTEEKKKKNRVKKGGGRVREEKEVAHELQGEREKRENTVCEKERESVSGFIGSVEREGKGDQRQREPCVNDSLHVCVCKRGTVVSGLISLPELIRSIYFKCCFNLSNLCRIWPLPSGYMAALPRKAVKEHTDAQRLWPADRRYFPLAR